MLFKEPTLLELKAAWQQDPQAFYAQNWEDTAYSAAEWAWMVADASFWTSVPTHEIVAPRQADCWWDWLCERVKGPVLAPVVRELLRIDEPASAASLTTFLVAYQRQKTKQTALELDHVITHLSTPQSLQYLGALGESPLAAACAIGEPVLLRSLLQQYARWSVKWDAPNDKQQGYWPLHFCVANRWSGGVKELVRAGAVLDVKSKHGQTPADLAEEIGWSMYKKAVREGADAPSPTNDVSAMINKPASKKPESVQMDLF